MSTNVWLPGNSRFTFNTGATSAPEIGAGGEAVERMTFTNDNSGVGIVYNSVTPNLTMTKPPKIRYQTGQDMRLILKDSDGWFWVAPMPAQATMKERGWSWSRFELHTVQTNTGTPPLNAATGRIEAYQFQSGDGATYPAILDIAYMAAVTPQAASAGSMKKLELTITDPGALTFKVGDVALSGGTRRPLRFNGAVPFGLQLNGPSRNGVSTTPYRGPFISGYQNGTPWVFLNNPAKLSNMLDMLIEAQVQFTQRHPTGLVGPWMHCYLPAVWDSEQVGTLDSWVWDAPDGNPAWNGWQYRTFESMARTWDAAKTAGMTAAAAKAATTTNKFLAWLSDWLNANPTLNVVPADWGPPGWTMGQPLPPSSYLDPRAGYADAHAIGLALKGAIFAGRAGADLTRSRNIIRRCIASLQALQVKGATDPMRGCFTPDPGGFVSYGFHQGEIMDALALARANPSLLQADQ